MFRTATSMQTLQKNCHKNRTSTDLLRSIVAVDFKNGEALPTKDVIKKANQSIKLTAKEHFDSYEKLSPFLHLFKELNPGFQYKIDREFDSDSYERVAILFPYSVNAIKNCYNIYGIDSAFLDGIEIPDSQIESIKEIVDGLPDDLRLMFQRGYISALTGRTYNNEMIIFAVCLNHGETTDNYDFLLDFVLKDCNVIILLLSLT